MEHFIKSSMFNRSKQSTKDSSVDVVLIGAGIMSTTLGVMLKQLQPNLRIAIYERLDSIAGESSDAWNNAGTGHSALCELNYTPERADGTIDCSKAIDINESFEISKQFWAYLVEQKLIDKPETFITNVPHMSFVWGDENVEYLKKRHTELIQHPLFKGMEYSEDHAQLKKWIPLVMENRDANQKVAATYMPIGTDVNFGALTRGLMKILTESEGVSLHLSHEVKELEQQDDSTWTITVKDEIKKKTKQIKTKFIFIGAGGGALPLLQKSGIPEAKGYGGFPVGGEWLKCINPAIIARHHAKVYGKASVGSPPMSVPHLDSRLINGEQSMLFGPYAGFSTRFLKHGSLFDLASSIKLNNIRPMLSAGINNIPLTEYLIKQVMQSSDDRLAALRDYYPDAKQEDWVLEEAGQRVQVIKNDPELGGILEFGTEVVSAADGSIAALLGASPGASTSVAIMLKVLDKCFEDKVSTNEWQTKLKQMIPSYGEKLSNGTELCNKVREWDSKTLGLEYIPV